ncbi:hypothetical protein [Vibrio sp. T11.5]|uniref:hypothetical protein n=1 Tax=Vibrio sp. T11.5 TaxID=2998836 RepID=UPI0022CDB909|nr:hypothetical protein [Vibrio sp. T11.5]MDA0118538.1 hypothetical protein [Vibrio sp. T11.5]
MAALEEQETWEDEIYQLEETDPVKGGPHGVDNTPHRQLANRTKALKKWQEEHVVQAKQAGQNPHPQYLLTQHASHMRYDPNTVYLTGMICWDVLDGKVVYFEWYSNQENIKGVDPKAPTNRHEQWPHSDKPFYWNIYTGRQVGMPFYWLSETPPEWAVMEVNVDLPIAVYWRLAEQYPHLVTGDTINTGEIRGEFLRVLDQGRGVDESRINGSHQSGSAVMLEDGNDGGGLVKGYSTTNSNTTTTTMSHDELGYDKLDFSDYNELPFYLLTTGSNRHPMANGTSDSNWFNHRQHAYDKLSDYWGGTRPRNVARPMAIAF